MAQPLGWCCDCRTPATFALPEAAWSMCSFSINTHCLYLPSWAKNSQERWAFSVWPSNARDRHRNQSMECQVRRPCCFVPWCGRAGIFPGGALAGFCEPSRARLPVGFLPQNTHSCHLRSTKSARTAHIESLETSSRANSQFKSVDKGGLFCSPPSQVLNFFPVYYIISFCDPSRAVRPRGYQCARFQPSLTSS